MGLTSDTLECVPQKSEPDIRPTLNVLAYQKTGVPRRSFDDIFSPAATISGFRTPKVPTGVAAARALAHVVSVRKALSRHLWVLPPRTGPGKPDLVGFFEEPSFVSRPFDFRPGGVLARQRLDFLDRHPFGERHQA